MIEFTEKEVETIAKLFLSCATGFEHWSMGSMGCDISLFAIFDKMGFKPTKDLDSHEFHELVFHEKSIDKMVKMLSKLSQNEAGDLLYSIVKLRNCSDSMGGQFSREFDTFLVHLLSKVFYKYDNFSLYDQIAEKFIY